MNKLILAFVVLTSFILSACGPSSNNIVDSLDSNETIESLSNAGYPPPASIINNSYPPPQQGIEGYPVPISADESKRFTIDEPVEAGSAEITGTGPANIPIKVINISFVGETIGSGIIENDGTFRISLATPLEANHVIGLQLGDQSLETSFIDGPDYTNIPMIGLVLTQAVVQQR